MLIYIASIITAFVSGMVALFAPCCITILFPAYVGTIFKNRYKVFISTLIFSFGLAVIMVPLAIGFRGVTYLVDANHNFVWAFAGYLMLAVGVMTLFNIKIPIPGLHKLRSPAMGTSPISIFLLGLFSGLTSVCCAPVLLGAITLSSITSGYLSAGILGLFYVWGMTIPLLVLGLISDSKKIEEITAWKNKTIKITGKEFLLSQFIGGVIFLIMGVIILYLVYGPGTDMPETASHFNNTLTSFLRRITSGAQENSAIAFGLFAIILFTIYWFIRKILSEKDK